MFIKKEKEKNIFKKGKKGPKDRRRSGREGAAPPRSSFEGEKIALNSPHSEKKIRRRL
jgi:hypothetical protein